MYIYFFKNPWKIFRIATCTRRGNSSYVHFDNFCNLLPDYILDYLKALYYVCVKRITLYNCLCSSSLSSSPSSRFSASRVWNIGASHIWDFGHCHNVKSHVCCYASSISRQKTDSGISKNNSSIRPGLSLARTTLVWRLSCSLKCPNLLSDGMWKLCSNKHGFWRYGKVRNSKDLGKKLLQCQNYTNFQFYRY